MPDTIPTPHRCACGAPVARESVPVDAQSDPSHMATKRRYLNADGELHRCSPAMTIALRVEGKFVNAYLGTTRVGSLRRGVCGVPEVFEAFKSCLGLALEAAVKRASAPAIAAERPAAVAAPEHERAGGA